jgi:hypothetical protein
MNFMVWSVALMYVYWMLVRDILIPLAYTEIFTKELREKMMKLANPHLNVLGLFTFITSLLFLAMYYYFSNT